MQISIIIYSKDRALQLDLLLRSIFKNFRNVGDIVVLYDYSSIKFLEGYNVLKYRYSRVKFIKQSVDNFRQVIIEAVHSIKTVWLLPLCDDDVFFRELDVSTLMHSITDDAVGLSLRHSKKLDISYHTNCSVPLPPFIATDNTDLIKWDWTKEDPYGRWGYPYMAGGMIYSTEHFSNMISTIEFILPNSMENAMNETKRSWNKKFVYGLIEQPIINVSINKVQIENYNRGGRDVSYTIHELNSYILSSKEIDLENVMETCGKIDNCEFVEIPLQIQKIQ